MSTHTKYWTFFKLFFLFVFLLESVILYYLVKNIKRYVITITIFFSWTFFLWSNWRFSYIQFCQIYFSLNQIFTKPCLLFCHYFVYSGFLMMSCNIISCPTSCHFITLMTLVWKNNTIWSQNSRKGRDRLGTLLNMLVSYLLSFLRLHSINQYQCRWTSNWNE